MLKQGLTVKLGQSLTMSPQLQQAIRLLQLSTVELQQEINNQLEINPLLQSNQTKERERLSKEQDIDQTKTAESPHNDKEENNYDNIPSEYEADANWNDIYDGNQRSHLSSSISSDDKQNFIENMGDETSDISSHLIHHIEHSNLSIQDKATATLIAESINSDGFLDESLEDIHANLEKIFLIEMDEVEAMLTFVQQIGPIGIGARSLEECLTLQLDRDHSSNEFYKKTKKLINNFLDLLYKRDYVGLKRRLNIKQQDIQSIIELIQQLNPKPGNQFSSAAIDYVVPDVFIRSVKGEWTASLNQEQFTGVSINQHYKNLLTSSPSANDKKYIKEKLNQANWFIKSIQSRNKTLLDVSTMIIKQQIAFLEHGEEAMKPMVLKDIATPLGLHESTVSRITNRKYMHTPRGTFELKYFFSSHVSTNLGGECSSTAIQAMIKKLITEENEKKPLSDSKLALLLKEQGINVARRTVAKYRESQAIPSSHERKALL